MTFLESLQYDFALGDTKLFNEFDTSHFISNAKSAITNKVEAVNLNIKFDYYTSMIEKAIANFSSTKLDKETINEFLMKFNTLTKLDSADITVRDIEYTDVISFKPQYLAQFTSMVQIAIDKALRGETDQNEVIKYISGEIPEKIERQIVKTSLMYGVSSKDLIKVNSEKLVKADTAYVKGKLIPFVSKYEQIKNDTITEANSVLNAIRESEETIKAMCKTIDKIKATSNLDGNKLLLLNQISYNAIRSLIEVVSYVSYMVVRKLNIVNSNIISCNELYINITNIYSDNTFESAYDQNIFATDKSSLSENLLKGQTSAYDSLSESIYDFNSSLPDLNYLDYDFGFNVGLVNQEIDQAEYDKTVYEDIIKAYLSISTGLDVLSVEGGDFLLIYDDIIKRSGFSVILEERFQNEVRNIASVTDSNTDRKRLLAEIKEYPTNMENVAKIVSETYAKLKYLQTRYDNNVNNEYSNTETIKEIKVFITELEDQYKELTTKVANAFFERLRELGKLVSETNSTPFSHFNVVNNDVDVHEGHSDYIGLAYESVIEECDKLNKLEFDNLQMQLYAEKVLALKGVKVVFEADGDNQSTTTGNTQPATNQASTTPTQTQPAQPTQQDKTKVSVQDNSTQANTTNNKSILSKISEFFRNMLERFNNVIKKNSPKNTKWLADNKNELLNRSYSNVSINILPYGNIQPSQITGDIDKVKLNVKTITAQNIESIKAKDDVYRKLFPFISGLSENNGKLGDQISKYYKVGTDKLEVISVSNSELKNLISTVIYPFCEEYYSSFSDTLNNNLSALGTASDEAINAIGADNKEKIAWISEAVKMYSGAVLNAVTDRNRDYMKVLTSLLPKTPNKPIQPETNNQTNTETNTDNNQNAQ